MTFKNLHSWWSQRKLSHDVVKTLAVHCRILGAERLIATVNWMEERELSMLYGEQATKLREAQEVQLLNFKTTKPILEWQRQYTCPESERPLRHKPLLFIGASCSGKTRKAISLYGHANTLVVNCQGLGSNLPSLRAFRRSEHLCIVFDEISSAQVLANKMVFQAGVDELTLAQSQCNAHAYTVWLYGVPMVLCSNDFQLQSTPKAKMADEDVAYLAKNIINASLPPGELWYHKVDDNAESSVSAASDSDMSVSSVGS